jgi:tetratricopeptide (TPR) repeat protein
MKRALLLICLMPALGLAAASGPAEDHLRLARALLAKGRRLDAAEEYRVALRLAPDDTEASTALASLQAGGVPTAPSHSRALAELADGQAAYRESRLDLADISFRQALAVDPSSAEAEDWLAKVQSERFQHDADQPFDSAVADIFEAALKLARQGRADDAVQKLCEALKLNPSQPQVLEQMERLKGQASEQRKARSAAELCQRGAKAMAAGDLVEAFSDYQQAVAAAPKDPVARGGLDAVRGKAQPLALARCKAGSQALAQGKPEAALIAFRQAADLDPELEQARQGLQRARSLAEGQERSQAQGQDLKALLGQGRQALAAEDADQAERSFSKALALEPGSAEASRGLEKARQMIKGRQSQDRQAAAELMAQASRLEEQGALEEALALAQKALARDPQCAGAKELASRLTSQLSTQDAAREP